MGAYACIFFASMVFRVCRYGADLYGTLSAPIAATTAMIDALPATTFEPPALVHEVRKRRKRRDRSDRSQRRRSAAYAIGAIILLTRDDGSTYECQITHQTPDGQWWCTPLD